MSIEEKVDGEADAHRGDKLTSGLCSLAITVGGLAMLSEETMREGGYLLLGIPVFAYGLSRICRGIRGYSR